MMCQLAINHLSNSGSELHSELDSKLDLELDSKLGLELDSKLGSKLIQFHPYLFHQRGHCVAGFYCFYDFIINEIKQPSKKVMAIWNVVSQLPKFGYFNAFKSIVFTSEKPIAMHFNNRNQLHKDGAMAAEYEDGLGVYCLNGVTVSKEIVMTSAEQLDPRLALTEKNVEVRREILRKVGMERFIQVAKTKSLHQLGNYTLLEIPLSDDLPNSRWLKMLNPSIGIWHVERVGNECSTVEEALHWRKPDVQQKIPIDDIEGEDWFLQGDVSIWPLEAKSLKRFPQQIT